ncbi:MAG: hypothetical protein LBO62_07660 [Endomicrobium sp.]|jgi:hypothetical protein|nr:hypothetical protein [Endomicrobium sp.]
MEMATTNGDGKQRWQQQKAVNRSLDQWKAKKKNPQAVKKSVLDAANKIFEEKFKLL